MMLSPPAALEAVLFSAGEPLSKKYLAHILGIKENQLEDVLRALRESLISRGLSLIEAPEGLELRTSVDASAFVKKLRENELSRDLGRAGLETLAIILYRKSAVRSDVDWIRGVNSSTTLRSLLLRGLIERTEDPADRRRARYRVTTEALAHLGLQKSEEAPEFDALSKALAEAKVSHEVAEGNGEEP